MDQCLEALIGFACAHGDALELFEFTEEVFDEMPPAIDGLVNVEGSYSLWPLGYYDASTAFIEFMVEPVAVEMFSPDI